MFLNPEVISVMFGGVIASFDLQSGDRIRLQDIVDVSLLSKAFWEIAQNETFRVYYKDYEIYCPDVDIRLPDLTAEELLVLFSNADTQNNGSLAESYFYYDGIGIRINDGFSAFVSYEDIRYMLNHDYWSEFVLQNGYVPTIHESPG